MEREELHSAFVRRFPAISLSHSHMHTHAHSWIYCHSVRLARTASMGEILMGYICLLLRVCKLSPSLVAISKGQVWSWGSEQHVTGGSGKVVAQGPAQARRKQEWATKNGPGHPDQMLRVSSVHIYTNICISASVPLHLTSSGKGELLSSLVQGLLEMFCDFCHRCAPSDKSLVLSQLSLLPYWSFQLLWALLIPILVPLSILSG